eukprot:gene8375-17518_t
MTLRDWLPTAEQVAHDLTIGTCRSPPSPAYALMIPLLQRIERKVNAKAFAQCWNFGLALFSLCGFIACAPVLFLELYRNGFYFTCCAPAPWYGGGVTGLFVALFIYSKFAELVDTALALLGKRRLIFLHWWHHATVLLYCWHSYSTQIATGLWFATMNYFVHSIMYAYYGCMGVARLRPLVKKHAIYVTLLQLAQMVVGIGVTVRAVVYQVDGRECAGVDASELETALQERGSGGGGAGADACADGSSGSLH